MSKQIKFNSIAEFVSYPNKTVIASKGFTKHADLPKVYYGDAFKNDVKEVLSKEIDYYQNLVDSEKTEIDNKVIQGEIIPAFNAILANLDKLGDELNHTVFSNAVYYSKDLDHLFAFEESRKAKDAAEHDFLSYLVAKIGDDIYEVSVFELKSEECQMYHEVWKKNDTTHRYGGEAAETRKVSYFLPDFEYMNENYQLFFIDGKEIKRVDLSMESEQEQSTDQRDNDSQLSPM